MERADYPPCAAVRGMGAMNIEEKVCDTLVDMMEEMPFEKIRVTALADRAGISRSSFYVHYQSTYDVLQQVEEMVIDEIITDTTVSANISRRELIAITGRICRNIHYFEVLTGENGSPSFYSRLAKRNRSTLDNIAKELNSPVSDLVLEAINEFTLAGKIRLLQWFAENESVLSVTDMAAILGKLHRSVNEVLLK